MTETVMWNRIKTFWMYCALLLAAIMWIVVIIGLSCAWYFSASDTINHITAGLPFLCDIAVDITGLVVVSCALAVAIYSPIKLVLEALTN